MSNSQQTTTTVLREMMDSGALNSSVLSGSPFIAKTNPNAGVLSGASSHPSHPYFGQSIMDYITENPMQIKIHRAANGFIVQSASREGDRATVHVATTIEEVNNIITTELVTKKLEGK